MNTFMNNLENAANYTLTANGALAHKSTMSKVYDMFAFGGAYRNRSDEDCILLFKNALAEDVTLALKCLFYLRDIRGGQGERRFFRTCFRWLANTNPKLASRNLNNVHEYGRWDDLIYACIGTKVSDEALAIIKNQLNLDINSKTPSLLGKWMPSENASSAATKKMGSTIREYLGLTHKQYRKVLSELRSRINIVEKLMSENRWDEIEFDKIPSKAGLIYKNAFARRDIIAKKYESFIKDENTKVNADTLYPYDIVKKALHVSNLDLTDTERVAVQKYWDAQRDYFKGKECNMIAVVDTSGSMTWGSPANARPIDVAISLGLYCAERNRGDFANKYISFSSRPQLIETNGVDIVDKVCRIYRTNLCADTNLEATFDLLLSVAKDSKPGDIPETIAVISDMQINSGCVGIYSNGDVLTLMETIREKWRAAGIKMPKLVYWNVNASSNTILDLGPNVSCVSGCSPIIFEMVTSGKTGLDIMLDKLLHSGRYDAVK